MAVDAENRQFLEPNAYIQSDDAEIRRLAQELAGQEKDAFTAALAMERWVAEHMTFDLGIVFAPATEVFHSRRGTCVGYATILATLAQASGIPSRVAMGYVYAQGMFGGHAWAEILAGKEWIPLDAAIGNTGVADATHLTIIASSLAGGPGEMSLGAAQQIFGQVDISILEYETGGKTTVVPADAKPFTAEGSRYANPWLGIALTKPTDFAFSKLDAIWPDPTVVGLTGPGGVKAGVEELPAYPWQDLEKAAVERLAGVVPGGKSGKLAIGEGPAGKSVPAIYSANGKKAAAAFGQGVVLLVLKVEGPDAAVLLRQLAAGFEFR
jgi:transglutaminase-like putative cysteine protease